MKHQTLFGSLWRKARRSLGGGPPSILVAGTTERCGKSWVVTAICRHLKRRGVRAAPFQAASFAAEGASCPGGGSIAAEQARQAEACGVAPTTDMNPYRCVAAPGGGHEIFAHGLSWKKVASLNDSSLIEEMTAGIKASYERLADEADIVVIDGMGAAAELDSPISAATNLALAEALGSRVLLTCDSDRGGVFALVAGTIGLLTEKQQRLINTFVINGFIGETESFAEGVEIIEERSARPCLGVLPRSRTIRIGEGDATPRAAVTGDELRVVILDLPGRVDEFVRFPRVEYVTEPTRYDPDIIIIPPTSSTLGDLLWMKKIGLDRWALDRRKEGTAIWGFGGGSHMLGRFVSDPGAGSPERQRVPGLGLLPTQADMLPNRGTKTLGVKLWEKDIGFPAQAPELPSGDFAAGPSPFADVDGQPEGFRQRGIVGTVLEGCLQNEQVVEDLLDEVAQRRSKPARTMETPSTREEHYEKLADWFEDHADIALFDELYLK